jgi:hypothetical protein
MSEKLNKKDVDDTDLVELDKKRKLNKSLGYPDPPSDVYAVGMQGKAGIWWSRSDTDDSVVEWQISRYRRDGDNEWNFKGSIIVKFLKKNQAIYDNLTNGSQVKYI